MKKLLACTVLTLLLVLNFNVQNSMAKITRDQTKVSFTMTEDNTGFFMSMILIQIIIQLGFITGLQYLMRKNVH